jgi:hypothetical protein
MVGFVQENCSDLTKDSNKKQDGRIDMRGPLQITMEVLRKTSVQE